MGTVVKRKKNFSRCYFIHMIIGSIFVLNSYLLQWFDADLFASEICALLGALILSLPIFITALRDLVDGKVYMNELVALALVACFVQQDFRTSGVIGFFMLLSLLIEQRSAVGASESVESLIKLTPKLAKKIMSDGSEVVVDARMLEIGDIVRIRPGENFPADGVVKKGISSVNEASITGESLPKDKVLGDDVFAGTTNLNGLLEMEVSRVGDCTTLGKVKQMIEGAENNKTAIMRLIDRYVGYYTPVILMLAVLVWFFTHDMNRLVAVLVVACPVALVLAVPSASVAALATAARSGLLLKNVSQFEVLAEVDAVVFDKTGTLTYGNLVVSVLHACEGVDASELLEVAINAESISTHPVATAIGNLGAEVDLFSNTKCSGKEFAGKGVEVKLDGEIYRAGRLQWFEELGEYEMQEIKNSLSERGSEGLSVVVVAKNNRIIGWIGLSDQVRESCNEMIVLLKKMRIDHLCMVTGDNISVAKKVANKVGIELIKAGCLPEDKVEYVELLRKNGVKVLVVGDGVNDAPALASGDSSLAMGAGGSDIAVSSAEVALMNEDLLRIPFLIKISRLGRRVMNQNLLLGLFFIIGGLYLSSMGMLSPILAAVVHTVSSLAIIFNSARLVKQVPTKLKVAKL